MTVGNRGYTILCIGHQWDKYQRRYRSLMSRLAKRPGISQVIYVESPWPLTSFARFVFGFTSQYDTEMWQRILRNGIVHNTEGVYVVSPLALLPWGLDWRLGGELNIALMQLFRRALVKRVLKKIGADEVILWISHPYFTDELIGTFGEKLVCYDLCDDYTLFQNPFSRIGKRIAAIDDTISRYADLIFVSSQALLEKKKLISPNTYLVPNGVDFNYFQQRSLDRTVLEEWYLSAKRPILVFLGRVTNRTDLLLMEKLANTYPQYTIALIGPVAVSKEGIRRLKSRPNVYFLGEKPYHDVPAYLAYADVCLNPIVPDSVTNSMDTMKLYSYLASGKPIVSTLVATARVFNEVVQLAENHEEFIRGVAEALLRDTPLLQEKRKELARQNSWDARVDKIHSIMMGAIHQKASR